MKFSDFSKEMKELRGKNATRDNLIETLKKENATIISLQDKLMTVLELPERFLNKEKDLKKNISAITLEDETDKKSKSLFQTYSLNRV